MNCGYRNRHALLIAKPGPQLFQRRVRVLGKLPLNLGQKRIRDASGSARRMTWRHIPLTLLVLVQITTDCGGRDGEAFSDSFLALAALDSRNDSLSQVNRIGAHTFRSAET